MALKLLADMHISPLTVQALRKNGYDISRVSEYLPPTASDEEIIDLATRQHAVILTQDLDFSALIAKSGRSGPSLLSLRLGNAAPLRVNQLLLTILPTLIEELEEGSIVSVDDAGIRVRKLPIG
ncbi:MAG: DUF5615 family PIN-like protein [Nitrospirae bacterium]|nr:DUF5615 family PIN-like protein [Nitrospirota bacterium]